jgi:hypothetical protein
MNILLIVILILLLGGAFHYSPTFGPWPAGGLGIVLLVILILVVTGRI